MKILFNCATLNYRGTTVATTDYAKYNQEILNNESIICYNSAISYQKDMGSEDSVIKTLEQQFKVLPYTSLEELEQIINVEKIDLSYFIGSGQRESIPQNVKTAVHAVFQFYEPFGSVYAYISEWLSSTITNFKVPYVPHIVNLPEPTMNYKDSLGIGKDKIVIGRIGGYYTFDIPWVKQTISKFLENNKNYIFLFVGTEPFLNHDNVKYIKEIHDPQIKSNFINTCDAMLHARQRGESFGLAIAEFLYLNKPVFAWNNGHDKNHLLMLKDSETLYNNENDLIYLLQNTSSFQKNWSTRVLEFSPNIIMNKFKEVFL
jgi:hypothetical protein